MALVFKCDRCGAQGREHIATVAITWSNPASTGPVKPLDLCGWCWTDIQRALTPTSVVHQESLKMPSTGHAAAASEGWKS